MEPEMPRAASCKAPTATSMVCRPTETARRELFLCSCRRGDEGSAHLQWQSRRGRSDWHTGTKQRGRKLLRNNHLWRNERPRHGVHDHVGRDAEYHLQLLHDEWLHRWV